MKIEKRHINDTSIALHVNLITVSMYKINQIFCLRYLCFFVRKRRIKICQEISWAVVFVEFCFAYALEILLGSPCSFRLACRKFDPRKIHPMIFESAIINATVGIMCPAMSLIAAFLYFPYYSGFNMWTLLANWLKLVCFNFPVAFFTQMYFIQPLVRTLFKVIFAKDIKARAGEVHVERPKDETNDELAMAKQSGPM